VEGSFLPARNDVAEEDWTAMTSASLKEKPVRDLARMARQYGVAGWHAMRKDQLIRALVRKAKARRSAPAATLRPARPTATKAGTTVPQQRALVEQRSTVSQQRAAPQRPGASPRNAPVKAAASPTVAAATPVVQPRDPEVMRRLEEARSRLARIKSLATPPERGKSPKALRDRLVVMVRGPHWLHAFWEVTPRSIGRAEAALGQEWHGAKPVLRLLQIESGAQGSPSERVVREIEIHGGVKNWFIDVRNPPMSCRVDIGYRAFSGRFHSLARSNAVSLPGGTQGDTLDTHWGDIAGDCDRIYAMSGGFSPENNSTELQELFEERLNRPMGPPASRRTCDAGDGHPDGTPKPELELDVDAEMIVYGATKPGSYVTLQGEPVKLGADGTFRVRVEMPNKRQVIPIVANAPDGAARQTVVLAVERNTKIMEPHASDMEE
jgi:hypothetical protein